ncbi:hypothetical protein DYI26_24250, partial [Halomonas litopenaei]|nr:hypothetical protein [Halomonas litopenaei]
MIGVRAARKHIGTQMTSLLMKFGQPRIVIALTVVLAVAVGGLALWRTNTFYFLSHHMAGGGHMHGAD